MKVGDYVLVNILASGSLPGRREAGRILKIFDAKKYTFNFLIMSFGNNQQQLVCTEDELTVLSDEQAMLSMLEAE